METKQKEYRPFGSRKHFVYIGDLSKDHQHVTVYLLANQLWPLIKKEIPEAELHIYSSAGSNAKNLNKK